MEAWKNKRKRQDGITMREFMKKSAGAMVAAITSGLVLLRSRPLENPQVRKEVEHETKE